MPAASPSGKPRPKLSSQLVSVWLEPQHVAYLDGIAKRQGVDGAAGFLTHLVGPMLDPDNHKLAWHIVGVSQEDEAVLRATYKDGIDEQLDFIVAKSVDKLREEQPTKRGRGRA